jgi:hypothetical protein
LSKIFYGKQDARHKEKSKTIGLNYNPWVNLKEIIMKLTSFKTLALATAAVAVVAFLPQNASATPVQATIATNSAITVADGVDINFGTWLIIVRSAETPTITLDNAGAIVTGGITNSTLQNLTPGTGVAGTVTVDLPAGTANTVLQMSRTAPVAFTDTGLSISAVTYTTATETGNNAFLVTPATEPVTVVAGGTPETVTFGATITATATPLDANSPHVSSFDVSFAY